VTPAQIDQQAQVALLSSAVIPNLDAAFNVAHRLVWNRHDAQDVVQNAFIKAMRNLDQLRDPTKARPWLLAITYREALMVLRSRRDTPTDPTRLPDRVGRSPGPDEIAEQRELAATVHAAIDRLVPGLRAALVLRDIEGLPMAEVAAVLGIGASAAKMRVSRAREQLRTDLTGRI
jgi:RNA polymerase sigma-70 factor (ECF subfamily)